MSNAFKASPLYSSMTAPRALITALLGGTPAMKEAGRDYLPQEEAESNAQYNSRLLRSNLYNKFNIAVKAMVGKLLAKPIIYKNHESIEAWIEDCDRRGTHLNRFMWNVAKDAVAMGISFVLVDTPPAAEGRTALDDIQQGVRPYLVHVPASNLIGWRFDDAGNLVQARIREQVVVAVDEFEEEAIEQIRVVEPFRVRVFRKRKNEKGESEVYTYSDTPTDTAEVTLFAFDGGGEKEGDPFVASSIFFDLAYTNLRWWQSNSEQINILHVARVPILVRRQQVSHAEVDEDGNTIDTTDDLTIGAGMALDMGLSDSLSFVEHGGKAIESGRQDLIDLEAQMDKLAYSLTIRETSGDVTATETAVMSAEAHAVLQSLAGSFEDSLELVLRAMVRQAGGTVEPEVVINKDFGATVVASDMPLIMQLEDKNIITKKQALEESKRRGLVDGDVDSDKMIKDAEDQAAARAPVIPAVGTNDTNEEPPAE